MYKVTIIDKSMMDLGGILVRDEESLKALMDFAWNPCMINYVTTYNYTDIEHLNAFEVVAGIFGEKEGDHSFVKVKVQDGYSAGMITAYFMNNAHFPSGDEICARPVGEGDE